MNKDTIIRIAAIAAVAVVIGAAGTALAAEVAADEAREAAQGWAALQEALTGKERFAGAAIADVKSYEGKDGRGRFYVVSFKGGGFAVTSGDTEIAPILAYSEDGEFMASDENPLWVMLTTDVAGRTKRLENLAQSRRGAEDDEDDLEYGAGEDAEESSSNLQPSTFQLFNRSTSVNASAWARLREAAPSAGGSSQRALLKAANPRQGTISVPVVGPLCETRWSQGDANGGRCFNYYTPSNYVCGCVATACAQLMRALRYPDRAVPAGRTYTGLVSTQQRDENGEKLKDANGNDWVVTETWTTDGMEPPFGGPYAWDDMPALPSQVATDAQRQAIGRLTRDCGMAVGMHYADYGSGSSTAKIGPALVGSFGYGNAAVRGSGGPIMLSEQLDAMLPSFDMGSPCGVGISGHSIVSDGYGYSDGRIYIHYNFGWGEYSSATAWYTPALEGETDADYPGVMSIVYNIWRPDSGIAPGSSIVSGHVVGEDGETPVASATVTASDGVTGASTSAETDESGSFRLCLPPGYDYALTASTNGVVAASRSLGVVKCSSETVGNRVGVALVLGASAAVAPPELLHRWSFEGATDAERLADTGGASSPETAAIVCGSDPAAVVFAGGMVSLSGDGNGAGYLTLGTNTIPDTATLEFWAREDGVRYWSRVFDYGIDTTAYTALAWTDGTSQRDDRFSTVNSQTSCNIDDMMAPYTPGTMYHISLTYERDATDGSTMVRVMRRDAKTGELQRMGSRTVASFAMSSLANAVLYLGHSLYTSDADANATYDEVRVWSGVLEDAQLKANAVAGPSVADLAQAQQIASTSQPFNLSTPVGGHTATRRGRIAYGKRGSKGSDDISWPRVPLSGYSDDGEHDVSELSRDSISASAPSFLGWSQLRYDGWVEVTEDQAGWWTINQKFDDYFLFAIDGDFAVFNHTYSSAATSRVRVTEGWHRFTIVCGDTYGGYGASYEFGGRYVPFTVSVNGGEEMAFTSANFTFGSESGVVTLTEDADWTAGGSAATVLSPGTVIDLNGHTLRVAGLSVDGVGGAVVTNTAARPGVLSIPGGAATAGVAVADGVKVWNGGELKWVQETAETAGLTGEWDEPLAYDPATLRAALDGTKTFTPYEVSGGNRVTMDVTVAFDAIPAEHDAPSNTTQGAIWLGTNGCFQVWTSGGWVDVEAQGVTPETGIDYTFRFTFDYMARTYGVEVKTGLTGFTRLVGVQSSSSRKGDSNSALQLQLETPTTNFPLATSGSAVSGVRFTGDGVFTSLLGEYVTVEGFAATEEVLLKDNASVILDAAKAAWLNSCAGGKTAVGNAAAGLSAQAFSDAYLLNLDITDGTRSYTFEITDVDVGAENVTVAVTLTRTGEIGQPINGVLKFYGAATLEAFANPALQPLSSETISDDDFSGGNTATATYPKVIGSTTNTFFKAKIEER